jgi:hypothetical protein
MLTIQKMTLRFTENEPAQTVDVTGQNPEMFQGEQTTETQKHFIRTAISSIM